MPEEIFVFVQYFGIEQHTVKNPMKTKLLKVLQLSNHLRICMPNLRTKKDD